MKRIVIVVLLWGVACGGWSCAGSPQVCKVDTQSYTVGQTFPSQDGCNTCRCEEDGSVACTNKACISFCGGENNDTCKANEVCVYKVGVCEPTKSDVGVCKPIGTCSEFKQPVCGCDSQTYNNTCQAELAGITVRENKACPDPPPAKKDCSYEGKDYKHGTTATVNEECDIRCTCDDGKMNCNKPACERDCNEGGKTYPHGKKVLSDDKCTEYYCSDTELTVTKFCCTYNGKTYREGDVFKGEGGCDCGCDGDKVKCTAQNCASCQYKGKTYKDGAIIPVGDGCNTCGCEAGEVTACTKKETCGTCSLNKPNCPEEYHCFFSVGRTCNDKDTEFSCRRKELCDENAESQVCGCDGKTYKNICLSAQAGVMLAQLGQCKEKKSCGTRGTGNCSGANEFCDFPAGCGLSGIAGTCQEKPTTCSTDYQPVCGCNGQTYTNKCTASKAGISIEKQGKCN